VGLFNKGDIVFLRSDYDRENPLTVSHYGISGFLSSSGGRIFETGVVFCTGKKSKRGKKVQTLKYDEVDLML
jgi:hypothetical protein